MTARAGLFRLEHEKGHQMGGNDERENLIFAELVFGLAMLVLLGCFMWIIDKASR